MTQPIDFSQPQRLPLVPALDSRSFDLAKDAILKNCIAEKQEAVGGYKINKRFGTGAIFQAAPVGTVKGCGLYYNEATGDTYVITANATNYLIYRNGALLLGPAITGLAPVLWDFEQMATHLVLGPSFGSASCYAIPNATGVPALIVDVDFTGMTNRVGGFAYLNGRIYAMDVFGRIYASDIDNPLSWVATNVIQARSQPDYGIAVMKHLTYIVAFKQWSLEFFSDVGALVGSSLALVPGLQKSYGCIYRDTIRSLDEELFWVSSNRSHSPQVIRMVNAQIQIISTPSIEKVLSVLNSAIPGSTPLSSVCFKASGHSFYMINLPVLLGLPRGSLVYDITEDLWHFWTKYNQFTRFQEAMNYAFEAFAGGGNYFQDIITGNVIPYASDDTYVKDTVGNIESDIITSNIEFGTKRWKVLSRLSFGVDEQVGSELLVRYNDHDYDPAQWSRFRSVNLNQAEPFLQNEGRFKRRAYHFRHTQATKMRIAYVDMQLSLGAI